MAFFFTILRGRLTKAVFRCLIQSASTTGLIYMIIVGANVFSYFFTLFGLPVAFVSWVGHLNIPPLVIIFILLVVYIVLGAIFDENAALLPRCRSSFHSSSDLAIIPSGGGSSW